MFPLGFYTANALAGPIKQNLGLMYNFALGMLCSIVCFAYCLVFVKDSRKERDERIAKEREEMLGSKNENIGKLLYIEIQIELLSRFMCNILLNIISAYIS